MKNRKIVFAAPWKVEVQEEDFDLTKTPDDSLCLKNLYSLVSPGTELACLAGTESWFKLPNTHGYTAVSEVVAVGAKASGFEIGDRVYHFGKHQAYQFAKISELIVKVPEGFRGEEEKFIPFTRLATIAMTSIRVSEIELGDTVAVTGLGLVGNMAAQLARLQGAEVIGIDLSEERAEVAKRCGIDATVNPSREPVLDRVMKMTKGRGVETLIEATGVPKVFADNIGLVGKLGEAILLGSPRGSYQGDLTSLLNHSHLWNQGCVTIKGAHEWRLSVQEHEQSKHSMVRNSRVVLELMRSGKLKIEPLLTHTVSPAESPKAYEGLRNDKERYVGVVIDWKNV